MAEQLDLPGAEGFRLVADVYGSADGPPAPCRCYRQTAADELSGE